MAVAEVFGDGGAEDPNSGASLVELDRDSDVPALQVALARDPNVEAVSRVPVRYILVPATRKTRRKGAGATIAAAPPAEAVLWNLRRIRWDEARRLPHFEDACDINVAVLDTGIDPDHPERLKLLGRRGNL